MLIGEEGLIMAEYIEREAVLEVVRRVPYYVSQIKGITAADVVEVKHGRWVEVEFGWDDVYYDCSICGESFCLIDGTPTDNLYNFCPNCGADMREAGNE
jgi:hypothetical protein